MPDQQPHLFDRPRNVRRVIHGLILIAALLLAADFIVHRHVSHELEAIPGFYALYGFVGCVLLVLIAAQIRKRVMRPEDYYRERAPRKPIDEHD